jgi:uncharacterized OB-fold protein
MSNAKMGSHKPIPEPDELSEPFWEAVNQRKLVIQRCQRCRFYYHPPVGVCLECHSSQLSFEPVSGNGRVKGYSITRHGARHPAFEALQPYAVALVELEEQEGLYMLSNIPNVSLERIRVGLPVSVDFEEIVPGHLIPQFCARSVGSAEPQPHEEVG